MLGHPPHVLPVLFLGEPHHLEDPVQLIVVVRVAGLDVLLPAVEDGFAGQQLGEDAADGPDVDGLGVVPGAEQQLGGAVPEGDHHGVQVRQRLQRGVEEPREAHVRDLDAAPLVALAHHEDVGGFQVPVKNPVGVKIVNAVKDLV